MSRLLIVSEDEFVFLTAGVLPPVATQQELEILFRFATGKDLEDPPQPDDELIILAPSARADIPDDIDAQWVPIAEVLSAFGSGGEFDEETGTAVTRYAAYVAFTDDTD